MSRREVALAVVLRRMQWMLDEAAFDLGGGRFTCADCRELSESLREVAVVLDDYVNTWNQPARVECRTSSQTAEA
ncbi:hypothetical protein [Saccharopolyspora flava]|uniref:hypothetical protein n=1 Tax=Saccharopolyspora flava TaxID=95161 RepID=UPI000B86C11A|nr:hypothetical protein [Saccharopolyspora flava]